MIEPDKAIEMDELLMNLAENVSASETFIPSNIELINKINNQLINFLQTDDIKEIF